MTSLLLAALLVGDALALGLSGEAWDSAGGSWVATRVLRRTPPTPPWSSFQEGLIQGPEGDLLLFDSWGIPAIGLDTVLLDFEGAPPDRRSLWAITHEHRRFTITLSWGPSLSEAQRREARRRMADALVAQGRIPSGIGAALARADVAETEHFTLGYTHNAASSLVLAGFLLSLGWIPGSIRRARAARAFSRGRCPSCGYALAGLEGPVCPECGTELHTPAPAAAHSPR